MIDIFSVFEKIASFNKVKITTKSPEKILNRLSANGVYVSHAQYDGNSLRFNVINRRLKKMNAVLSPFNEKADVIEIYGTQKIVRFAKSKKIFFGILAVCVVLSVYLSGFLWKMEILSATDPSAEEIKLFLYKNGIRQSCPIDTLSEKAIRVLLLKNFPALGDADVSLRGCCLKITLSAKESPILVYDRSLPCDIVATKDAVISVLDVYSGTACVNEGDSVKKGDILIRGEIGYGYEQEEKSYISVHAVGKVLSENTVNFDDIEIEIYEPIEESEYISEKTYYPAGLTVTLRRKYDEKQNIVFTEYAKNVKIGVFEFPVLYDEKKIYNINNCRRLSNSEIYDSVVKEVQYRLGPKANITHLEYTLSVNGHFRCTVNAKAVYRESIAAEQAQTP